MPDNPRINIKVAIKNMQNRLPIDSLKVKKTVLETIMREGAKKNGEITVCFMDDRQIRELNLLYLGSDCPTDVISFDDSLNRKELLADIAVSTQAACRNAKIYKTTALYEMYLYVIHGVLHLLGYDDERKTDRLIMQKRTQDLAKIIVLSPKTYHP
jgi:probable rRNA maturation factor